MEIILIATLLGISTIFLILKNDSLLKKLDYIKKELDYKSEEIEILKGKLEYNESNLTYHLSLAGKNYIEKTNSLNNKIQTQADNIAELKKKCKRYALRIKKLKGIK